MRLPKETPVRKAMTEEKRKVRRPRGKPKLTWTKQMENDIEEIGAVLGVNPHDIASLTSDRKVWRDVGCAMSKDGKRQ